MGEYFVVYNKDNSIWCFEDEAYDLMSKGWNLYAVTDREETADAMTEEACYI